MPTFVIKGRRRVIETCLATVVAEDAASARAAFVAALEAPAPEIAVTVLGQQYVANTAQALVRVVTTEEPA